MPRPVKKAPAGGSASRHRGTRRDPGSSASGEVYVIKRAGSKPLAETLRGSVHESPVRRLPHARKKRFNRSLSSWKLDLLSSLCLRVINSDLERGKALLQLFRTRSGSVSGRKFGFQSAINFERVT